MEVIFADKKRLHQWILNYKNQLPKPFEKDSVKIATFREAAQRLKMELDHYSDFDEGNLRNQRRKGIEEIDKMLTVISEL